MNKTLDTFSKLLGITSIIITFLFITALLTNNNTVIILFLLLTLFIIIANIVRNFKLVQLMTHSNSTTPPLNHKYVTTKLIFSAILTICTILITISQSLHTAIEFIWPRIPYDAFDFASGLAGILTLVLLSLIVVTCIIDFIITIKNTRSTYSPKPATMSQPHQSLRQSHTMLVLAKINAWGSIIIPTITIIAILILQNIAPAYNRDYNHNGECTSSKYGPCVTPTTSR